MSGVVYRSKCGDSCRWNAALVLASEKFQIDSVRVVVSPKGCCQNPRVTRRAQSVGAHWSVQFRRSSPALRKRIEMDEKKPSTSDILAKIRAQKAAAASSAPAAEAPAVSPAPAAAPAAASVSEAAAPEAAAPKPAAPATKPGSTKDIMAAIRAKGGAPAVAASAPSPAPAPEASAAKPEAKPVVAAAGPRLSPQEMLKAIREGKTGAAVATPATAVSPAKAPVVAPTMPAKPVPVAKKGAAPAPARRSLSAIVGVTVTSATCFVLGGLTGNVLLWSLGCLVWLMLLSPFAAAWTALAGITGIWTLGTARFMFPNVLVEPPSKFKVGPMSDYPLNSVSNKWKDQYGVWIVHTDQYEGRNLVFALASVCTHLGCTPSWLDGEQKFKCPCHGSGFYMTGVNFEGPAPRPLERVGISIAEGMLQVDKSIKFQEEMGQWTDAASFIELA